jgi:MFS family permease
VSATLNLIAKYLKTFELLMVARFFSGLYCGLFSGVLPLYLSELAPTNLRGLIGGLYQLLIVLGILSTNIYGLRQVLGNDTLWPILAGGVHYIPLLVHLGLFYAVESPKYLFINKNDKIRAQRALVKLRGVHNVTLIKHEMNMLENEKLAQAQQRQVQWAELFKNNHLRHALLVAFLPHACQQFCGINAVS